MAVFDVSGDGVVFGWVLRHLAGHTKALARHCHQPRNTSCARFGRPYRSAHVLDDPTQSFDFTQEHVQELAALTSPVQRFGSQVMAMIAKGDELLDWREMVARYPDSPGVQLEGGDHAFSDFEKYIPEILGFLGIAIPGLEAQTVKSS